MAALVVANAALMRLIWANNGVPFAVNVIGAQNASGSAVTQGAVNALGTAIKAAITSSGHGSFLGTPITLQTVGLRNISIPNQVELIDVAAPAAGTGGTEILPPQIALCITLRTALAGRSFRGRCFLPGFAEAANGVGGTAGGSIGTAAVAFMEAIRTAMSGQSLPMAIVSRPAPLRVPPSVGFVTPVTSCVVRDLVWDTQRRRAVPGI